jgi:hypothetical protein
MVFLPFQKVAGQTPMMALHPVEATMVCQVTGVA